MKACGPERGDRQTAQSRVRSDPQQGEKEEELADEIGDAGGYERRSAVGREGDGDEDERADDADADRDDDEERCDRARG